MKGCPRCRGSAKLCYDCLSKLNTRQTQLIDEIYLLAADIYAKLDETGKQVWREVEAQNTRRLRK